MQSEAIEYIITEQGPTESSLNIVNETEQVSNREPESLSNVRPRGKLRRTRKGLLDNEVIKE